MSSRHRHVGDVGSADRLREAVQGMLARASGPVSTEEISAMLAATSETIDAVLSELEADGDVTRLPGKDGDIQWRTETTTVRLTHEANSYHIQDDVTGVVTRAATRPESLRRLAERLEQYESGRTAGAQIVGISETELSPDYAPTVAELATRYVEPDDRHLYVYVEGEGVRELTDPTHLNREYTVLGFSVTGLFDRASFADALPVSLDELLARTPIREEHFPLGMYKLIAVHPEHQGQGIGAALATHAMAYLAEHPPVVSMMWKRENDGNLKLADDYGAEVLTEFEETSPSKWQCPECGFDTACTCSSVFFGWGFE
ncbi:GNAT family N-acetyltransferase [Halorientalis halophila]|uniref:GNAT family N-acetyltransferase n=1 Tax=Halorientalis halophila TaxID=3108499 RepID=UPI00300B3592